MCRGWLNDSHSQLPIPTALPHRQALVPDLQARLQEALPAHHQLLHEVGRGGMSIVYLATDIRWVYGIIWATRGTRKIYRVPSAGGDPQPLTELPEPVLPWSVDVSPDGRSVVWVDRHQIGDLWVIENFDPEVTD